MMQLTRALTILNVPHSLRFFFPVLRRNTITVALTVALLPTVIT